MSKEDPSRYSLHYPSYLEPKKQVWIARKGDTMSMADKDYEVVQVVKPAIAGMRPKIVLIEKKEKE